MITNNDTRRAKQETLISIVLREKKLTTFQGENCIQDKISKPNLLNLLSPCLPHDWVNVQIMFGGCNYGEGGNPLDV